MQFYNVFTGKAGAVSEAENQRLIQQLAIRIPQTTKPGLPGFWQGSRQHTPG
ncbi:hypothetical protein RGUI_2462 [Rhodovulum sp. P5]|nr:hypothetical protein RGUI_2462 [Rhodovulum sp. P5]